MIRKQDGFTLWAMITMVIFAIAIAATSNIFTAILTNLSSIQDNRDEYRGVVGFETLRYDVEQADTACRGYE